MIRGDVHLVNPPKKRGREQHGRRYAVVVQANDLMDLSTVAICPTSQSAPPASFHPTIQIGGESTQVLCEMIRALDARKLGKQVGHLSLEEIADIDDALELVLGLG